jgi:hypothetical protein
MVTMRHVLCVCAGRRTDGHERSTHRRLPLHVCCRHLNRTAGRRQANYDGGVPDQKPPRLSTDERDTLLTMLQFQRDSLVRKVTGVPTGSADASPVDSGTTLLWLVRHLTEAELMWIEGRFAGSDLPPELAAVADTLDAAVEAYRDTWARVDAIVATSDLEDTCRRGEPANLRWVLTHLLAETARHAGHADILRELIDGQTGR